MLRFNQVALVAGTEIVSVAQEVPDGELMTCYDRFFKAGGGMANPQVLVNGQPRTPEQMKQMKLYVNAYSQLHNGRPVY